MRTELINKRIEFDYALNSTIARLAQGDVVAVPTETVYGLVADIYNTEAVNKIFYIKQRIRNKPLTSFCKSIEEIEKICIDIPKFFYVLAENFLPGPLAIILKKSKLVPDEVTGGLDTVAVRIPDNKFVISLLNIYKRPLASTSANISNAFPFDIVTNVYQVFKGKIPLIIDGGKCRYGKESTVIDLSIPEPQIFREGIITRKVIEYVTGKKII
ncbi:L-threonylcarbamoyladenylate synthase [Bacteroidota bacterium]